MNDGHPGNTWWRFVPRTRAVGVLAVVVWPIVLIFTVYALLAGMYDTTVGNALEVVVAVLAAWSLVRSVTGLAALRGRSAR